MILTYCRYSIRVGRSKDVRGPFVDKSGQKLLDGGGTTVYGSNHGLVYAPGGIGVLPENKHHQDIMYYHYRELPPSLERQALTDCPSKYNRRVLEHCMYLDHNICTLLTCTSGRSIRLELYRIHRWMASCQVRSRPHLKNTNLT